MRPIAARFQGRCLACDATIVRGQMIVPLRRRYGRSGWRHAACDAGRIPGDQPLLELKDAVAETVRELSRRSV